MLKTNKVKHEKLIANENKPKKKTFSSHFNNFFILQTTKKPFLRSNLSLPKLQGSPTTQQSHLTRRRHSTSTSIQSRPPAVNNQVNLMISISLRLPFIFTQLQHARTKRNFHFQIRNLLVKVNRISMTKYFYWRMLARTLTNPSKTSINVITNSIFSFTDAAEFAVSRTRRKPTLS